MTSSTSDSESYLSQHLSKWRDPYAHRKQIKERLAHRYKKFLPHDKDSRILEIGPGLGEFLELLTADEGYSNVCAVDLSAEVSSFCNKLIPGSTRTVSDTGAYLRESSNQFDCITMLHVLEHVPKMDVIPLMRSAYAALAPGGIVLLEVPNMQNPFTGLGMRYADFTHEVGFTDVSLEFVLQSSGFSEVLVFEPELPSNHWARPVQRFGQLMIRLLITAIYATYGHRAHSVHRVMSPELGAVAVKSPRPTLIEQS